MNRIKLTLAAALIGLSTVAWAEDPGSDSARQARMDEALQTYRGNPSASQNPKPGPFARAEASTKRGLKRAGTAVKHGAEKAGHAVATGARKTGDAIRHTGEKIQKKVGPKPQPQ